MKTVVPLPHSFMWNPFHRRSRRAAGPPEPDESPPAVVPAWAAELGDRLKTLSRATSRLSLRFDELEQRLDARPPVSLADAPTLEFGPVLEALDRLDEAQRVSGLDPAVADGLAAVGERLERFLRSVQIERPRVLGSKPDGKLVRVVGTHPNPELPPGAVTRIVRSAAVRGATVVREGEVLINESSS